ncbi:MAG: hypothetical protein RBS84_09935 [Kiritimatiellia bacterium]|jgi:hypothetical protein|nr:hypothetical protein [Kiritimatiellia bacterium]
MNQLLPLIVTFFLLTLPLSVRAQAPDLARPRLWTSASGAELMAVFVELSGEQVILRNRQGEQIRIPRAKLSAADQTLLDGALGAAAPPPEQSSEFAFPASTPPPAPDTASAPAQDPIRIAGTEIPLGEKTTFRVPLSTVAATTLRKDKNAATEAMGGLWLPPDFDPHKQWNILLVSATANASSIDHMFFYLDAAREAGGWIVVAADGPHAPPSGDTTTWRWEMAQAALLALEKAWPGARQWPIATGGFSGGAKRSGLLGAILCKEDWPLIGMYMGGCNQDMATSGQEEYRPSRAEFRKVPIYLSAGKQDDVASVQKANEVRLSMKSTGFREVRLETYDGAHDPFIPHITEALKWFAATAAAR